MIIGILGMIVLIQNEVDHNKGLRFVRGDSLCVDSKWFMDQVGS